jgi:predicted nucleic acid-binding protein
MKFVLDNSIIMVWGFEDEGNKYAEELLELMPTATAYVPSLWPLEVANALLVGERYGRISPASSKKFLAILSNFAIVVDDETVAQAWSDTISIARSNKLSSYDACYLEMAMRLGLPLATLDKQLRTTARKLGIEILSSGPGS